ncbi:MAG: phage portal protein [Candidatus Hodarchaeota archaeon]
MGLSCVALISNATSSVKWCLYRYSNNKKIEIEEHPILNLVNNKANNFLSSKDFFEIWATYLALQGKFYATYSSEIFPSSIEFLYPHCISPIPDKKLFISGFEYRKDNITKIYDSSIVLWSKFFDPSDAYEGLSPIKAMARTIDTENEAVDWNKNTFQNNAVPPGAIQVVNPSPELQEKLREDWLERYAGSNNARIPLVLNADKVSYTNFGMSSQDMDFLEQRKLNRVEICSGFNVPSQLVGDPSGQTYANYKEANKAFWENTIIPKYLDNIKNILNMDLLPRFANNLILEADLDNIPALQINREIKIENTNKLWESGLLKRSEARDSLDYDFGSEDEIYITDIKSKDNKSNKSNVIDFEEKKKNYYY